MVKQLTDLILEYLNTNNEANSLNLVNVFNEDHQKIIGAIKSLEAFGDLIVTKQISQKKWELSSEGQHVIKCGSHEAAVYNATPDDGILQSEILKLIPFAKVGLSKALVAGWIELDKNNGAPIVRKKLPRITDITQEYLQNIDSIPENVKLDYKKRKLLQEVIVKSTHLAKGPKFSIKVEKLETELTSELLANGAWKLKKFKPYNFEALGSSLEAGHLHPLLKVRGEFRKIFIEMGFTEMPTNNYVENSFWNFDALFQPQQHPARDAHDTFFIADPSISTNFPGEYLEKVRNVHSKGGYGSQGYRYDWKLSEAQKNLLRTHTTATSARMLYKLMQQGDFKPVKYFSIDRVFRNETLDATHLAEFHQIEGVIADYNLTLGDLIGTLYEFFKKLGITQLEFKPAYNPYTEPSMEIFCYHTGLNKWIEIGNSGMFRPELLLPMGIPNNVNVIAWGLSLERPTMIKYGLNNIRDLVGPKVDLEMVHNNPICRLDKSNIQSKSSKIKIQESLDTSISTVEGNKKDKSNGTQVIGSLKQIEKQTFVIFCDSFHPLYSLEKMFALMKSCFDITVSIHTHSTVKKLPSNLLNFLSEFQNVNVDANVAFVLIWKAIGIDAILQLPDMHEIVGEVNIARYINRLIESRNSNVLVYENNGPCYANKVDLYLDKIHAVLHGVSKRELDKIYKRSNYILGENISIVDIIYDSIKKRKAENCFFKS